MEWMKIETAPKDGTEIFIFRHGWNLAPVAKWAEYPGNPVVDDDEEECWMYGWIFDAWFTPGLDDGFLGWNEDIEDDCMPTLWADVPQPPKGE